MSLGHMTKQEQAITLGGMLIGLPTAMYVGRSIGGENGMFIGMAGMVILIFIGKAWAWQYTNYKDGFSNPEFERGQGNE